MKENVDLTEARDFRIKSTRVVTSSVNLNILSNPKKNLNIEALFDRFKAPTDDFYIIHDDLGVLQGNAACRASKRLCGEFGMGHICDCCGREIKPYIKDCLCLSCKESLSENIPAYSIWE
jgi:peptidyl-tRNA hydrolase